MLLSHLFCTPLYASFGKVGIVGRRYSRGGVTQEEVKHSSNFLCVALHFALRAELAFFGHFIASKNGVSTPLPSPRRVPVYDKPKQRSAVRVKGWH